MSIRRLIRISLLSIIQFLDLKNHLSQLLWQVDFLKNTYDLLQERVKFVHFLNRMLGELRESGIYCLIHQRLQEPDPLSFRAVSIEDSGFLLQHL